MTQSYSEYPVILQQGFAKALAKRLETIDVDTIRRCMSLAQVNITMGASDQTKGQFRIEKDEAANVLAITLGEYLS